MFVRILSVFRSEAGRIEAATGLRFFSDPLAWVFAGDNTSVFSDPAGRSFAAGGLFVFVGPAGRTFDEGANTSLTVSESLSVSVVGVLTVGSMELVGPVGFVEASPCRLLSVVMSSGVSGIQEE
jgi:hypothetical protein